MLLKKAGTSFIKIVIMVVDNFNKVAFRYEEIIKKQATNYYGYVGV